MARIVWDSVGERTFEAGVNKVVLYVDGSNGVPWNGVTSLDENDTSSINPIYFDGKKINDLVLQAQFSGVLRAFTYPDEFLPCEGYVEDRSGVFMGEQPRIRFNLCYRTGVGDDLTGVNTDYKLHLLYNVTAIPATKQRATLGLDVSPTEFEWNLTTIPEEVSGYKPTAHVVFNSKTMEQYLLEDLEAIFYGDDTKEASLPPLNALMSYISKWDRQIVVDNGDGTFTVIVRDAADLSVDSEQLFTLQADNSTVVDPNTYTIASTTENTEDL